MKCEIIRAITLQPFELPVDIAACQGHFHCPMKEMGITASSSLPCDAPSLFIMNDSKFHATRSLISTAPLLLFEIELRLGDHQSSRSHLQQRAGSPTATLAMEHRVDLPALYASREFADLTLVAANGEEFQVHRLVLGQYPQLKTLVIAAEEQSRRVQAMETAEAVRRIIEWLYGVPWPNQHPDTIKGRAHQLKTAIDVAHAAERVNTSLFSGEDGADRWQQYEIADMAKDAYAAAGRVMRTINSAEDGLRVLREVSKIKDYLPTYTAFARPATVSPRTYRQSSIARHGLLPTLFRLTGLRPRRTA